jgi:hypothetical protein
LTVRTTPAVIRGAERSRTRSNAATMLERRARRRRRRRQGDQDGPLGPAAGVARVEQPGLKAERFEVAGDPVVVREMLGRRGDGAQGGRHPLAGARGVPGLVADLDAGGADRRQVAAMEQLGELDAGPPDVGGDDAVAGRRAILVLDAVGVEVRVDAGPFQRPAAARVPIAVTKRRVGQVDVLVDDQRPAGAGDRPAFGAQRAELPSGPRPSWPMPKCVETGRSDVSVK